MSIYTTINKEDCKKGFIMGGSISSLGIGSGVLTSDVIDQLKEADTAVIITPMENKISINSQKQDSAELLTSLMKTFKASASALSYDTIFDNKTVEVTGEAEVEIEAGASVESFTLETTTLAKKDITTLGSVASEGTDIASAGGGTLEIKVGSDPGNPDKTINVAYTVGMTLSELSQAITDEAGDDVSVSILQTGDGAYNLVLTSASTGEDSQLTISDLDGNLSADLFDVAKGYEKVQTASDSEFKYNGITITRSTNEISDLILGVDITLKEEGDFSSVDIAQDTSSIMDELDQFTASYNTLMTNIHDMTMKDEETGAEGVFNSDSFIKSLNNDLSRTVTQLTSDKESLVNYGIDIDRYGTMTFDRTILETKISDDPDAVELFFTGGTNDDGDDVTGIFETIDDKLDSYTGYGELLSTFDADLKTEGDSLNDTYLRAKASLDTRYEIMTKRFIAYDAMISKLNSQFSSMQMMIDAETSSN